MVFNEKVFSLLEKLIARTKAQSKMWKVAHIDGCFKTMIENKDNEYLIHLYTRKEKSEVLKKDTPLFRVSLNNRIVLCFSYKELQLATSKPANRKLLITLITLVKKNSRMSKKVVVDDMLKILDEM